MRLEGKVAIVTGAASGIGQATAVAFAHEGALVALSDQESCSLTAAIIANDSGTAFYREFDVANTEHFAAFVDEVVKRWGGIDIVFNNAGIGLKKSILDVSETEFDRIFGVNVKGVFNGCKLTIPHMLRRGGGAIINVASNAGVVARADDAIYAASKHAVVGLTGSIALAFAADNIRANSLCPGPIDTPMFWDGMNSGSRAAHLAEVLASCPAARLAPVSDVVNAAIFLASDEATFITGAALPIDGGKAAGVMTAARYRMPQSQPG